MPSDDLATKKKGGNGTRLAHLAGGHRTAPARPTPHVGAVPLTWTHDSRTGERRYIHDAEVSDGRAERQCPACDLSLTPMLAGQPLRRNPTAHFRHPKGAQKDDCTPVVARLAAIGICRSGASSLCTSAG